MKVLNGSIRILQTEGADLSTFARLDHRSAAYRSLLAERQTWGCLKTAFGQDLDWTAFG